jgi:hypothetical protein
MEKFMVPASDPGIQLYVRNKHPEGATKFGAEKILLYVHGATYPSETAFDLRLNGLSPGWTTWCRALFRGVDPARSYQLPTGHVEVLLELMQPPVPLIVFGGGHDAVPLVRLASEMGWHVTVVDGRPAAASRTRFPRADAATLMRAIEAIAIGVAPVLHGEGKGA